MPVWLDIVVGLLGVGLIALGSYGLERSSERLAVLYGLPDVVTGAVVVAIGSSFPELTTAVLAPLLHGSFELGVSAIVGSALFNILVIPAAAGLASRGALDSSRDVVYKEALFYLLAVSVLALAFTLSAVYAPGPEPLTGRFGRWMALVPVGLYALYVFVQALDTVDHQPPVSREQISAWKQWAILAGSLLAVVLGVEGLVRAVLTAGDLLGVPDFVWGVTVVAAATSLPDLVVSVQAARKSRSETSLANILGSNTFDLLICVPAGVLLAGAVVVDLNLAVPLLGALTLGTIALFTMLRTGLALKTWESALLLGMYGVFVAWMIVESVGWVDTLPDG